MSNKTIDYRNGYRQGKRFLLDNLMGQFKWQSLLPILRKWVNRYGYKIVKKTNI